MPKFPLDDSKEAIYSVLKRAKAPMSTGDIADSTGIPKMTTWRKLQALVEGGYVEKVTLDAYSDSRADYYKLVSEKESLNPGRQSNGAIRIHWGRVFEHETHRNKHLSLKMNDLYKEIMSIPVPKRGAIDSILWNTVADLLYGTRNGAQFETSQSKTDELRAKLLFVQAVLTERQRTIKDLLDHPALWDASRRPAALAVGYTSDTESEVEESEGPRM